MKVRGVIFRIFFIVWLQAMPAFALIERRMERRFEVPDNAVLNVEMVTGLIRVIQNTDDNVVEIVLNQVSEVETEAAMNKALRAYKQTIKQDRERVTVSLRSQNFFVPFWSTETPVTFTYEIKVPKQCSVNVTTKDGSINLGSLAGNVVLNNETGAIFTGEIDGSVIARNQTGSIAITAASGPVNASTTLGPITVGRTAAATFLSSEGGYIELQRASGEVTVRGNGSAAAVGFVAPVRFPADISVSGGDLVLVMESSCSALLELNASVFGRVTFTGEMPFKFTEGAAGSSTVRGLANSGGPRILVRASGGNIRVRSYEAAPVE